MEGRVIAGGLRAGLRPDAEHIATCFRLDANRLNSVLRFVESAENANIALIQPTESAARPLHVILYPSVWSIAYSKVGTPYGRVHRDYHYQVFFTAIQTLAEVGCNQVSVETPFSGYWWKDAAYICLFEATRNLRAIYPQLNVFLKPGQYNPRRIKWLEPKMRDCNLQNHRPIGISPFTRDGFNMRRIIVEKADVAVEMAKVKASLWTSKGVTANRSDGCGDH